MAETEDVDKLIEEILSQTSSVSSGQHTVREPSEDSITEKSVLSEIEEEAKTARKYIPPVELYKIRFSCLEAWFLRSSSAVKFKFLYYLLRRLKNKCHLEVIICTANYYLDKLHWYTASYTTTNYIYDKKLNDHNRSLEKRAIDDAFKTDITWFDSLESHEQFETLIKLLKITHGELLNRFFAVAKKIEGHRNRRRNRLEDIIHLEGQTRTSSSPDSSLCSIGVKVPDDDRSPLAQNVEKRAKILNDAFSKYRHEVLTSFEGGKDSKKSPKKSEKSSKKSSKSSKSSKSGSTNRSSRNKGKRGKIENVEVDQIQQLPVWIVKQIFSFLDQKTLKKVRAVNSYWSYVIDDMSKERTCRKNLDKAIRKMEARVHDTDSEVKYQLVKPSKKITDTQKRLLALTERGAVHPKLRTLTKKLFTKAAVSPGGYESFPRSSFCSQNLLATPKYMLGELGKQTFKPRKPTCEQSCTTTGSRRGSTESHKLDDVPKCRKNTNIKFI